MGGVASREEKGKSRFTRKTSFLNTPSNKLLKDTREVRDMSKVLFDFMYTSLDKNELLDMVRNPNRYVSSISDLLEAKFSSIGYVIGENRMGQIFFTKYSDLDPTKLSQEKKKEHLKNVQTISFFIVSVFLLLGSVLCVTNKFTFISDNDTAQQDSIQPNPYGRLLRQIPRTRPLQTGGGLSSNVNLGAYEFLRYYLSEVTPTIISEYRNLGVELPRPTGTYLYKITPSLFIILMQNTENIITNRDLKSRPYKARFVLLTQERRNISLQVINASVTGFSPSDLYTDKKTAKTYPFTIEITLETRDKGRSNNPGVIKFTQQRTMRDDTHHDNSNNSMNDSNYSSGLNYDIITNILGINPPKEKSKKDQFKYILEQVILINKKTEIPYIDIYRPSSPEYSNDDTRSTNTIPNKTIQEVFRYLSSDKNEPHAIKRAKDLLDPTAINNSTITTGKSRLCETQVNTNLNEYLPTRAFLRLYYYFNPDNQKASLPTISAFVGSSQTEASGSPLQLSNFTTNSSMPRYEEQNIKYESEQYSQALQKLSKAFNPTRSGTEEIKSGSTITISTPPECNSKLIQLNTSDNLAEIRQCAMKILDTHVDISNKLGDMLVEIFNIDMLPEGVWKVSDSYIDPEKRQKIKIIVKGVKNNLLSGGFPLLYEYNQRIRNLLLEYYVKTETLYQFGQNIIVEKLKKEKETVAQTRSQLNQGGVPTVPQDNPTNPSGVVNKPTDPRQPIPVNTRPR